MPSAHAVLLDPTPAPRTMAATRQLTKSVPGGSGFGAMVAAHQVGKPIAAQIAPHKPAAADPRGHTMTESQQTPVASPQDVPPNQVKVALATAAGNLAVMPGSQASTPTRTDKGKGNPPQADSTSLATNAPLNAPQELQPCAPPALQPTLPPAITTSTSMAAVDGTLTPPFTEARGTFAQGNTTASDGSVASSSISETTSAPPPADPANSAANHTALRSGANAAADLATNATAPPGYGFDAFHDATAAADATSPPNRSALLPAGTAAQNADTASTHSDAAPAPGAATPSAYVGTASATPTTPARPGMPPLAQTGAAKPPAVAPAPPPVLSGHPAQPAASSSPAARAKPGSVAAAATSQPNPPAEMQAGETDPAPLDQGAPATPYKADPAPAHGTANPGTAAPGEAATNAIPQSSAQAAAGPSPNPAAPAAQGPHALTRSLTGADDTNAPQASPVEDASQAGAAQAAGGPAPPAPAPTPVAAAHTAAAPSAVAQVAQAVSTVHVAAGGQGQVTIHLQPGELGAVQVKIERAVDGTATVTVQVEKAATLQAMQQDISHLHQALDRAGVPSEQRQVSLHLAAPATTSGFGTDAGAGAGSGFSRGGQSQSHQQGSGRTAAPMVATTGEDEEAAPRWIAAGINITA